MCELTNLNSCTLPDAAKIYSASYMGLLKAVTSGELRAFDTGKGTKPYYRVYCDDVADFLRSHPRLKSNLKNIKPVEVEKPVTKVKEAKTDNSDTMAKVMAEKIEAEQKLLQIKVRIKELESQLMELLIEFESLAL